MSAYTAAPWHDFFMAAVGASAALLGLLFVSLSINIQTILKYPHLPGRAAATLGILLVVLVVCFFGLAPNEGRSVYGWAIVVVSSMSAGQIIWISIRRRRTGDRLSWTLSSLAQLLFPVLAILGEASASSPEGAAASTGFSSEPLSSSSPPGSSWWRFSVRSDEE
jgi:hypothetical protein